MGFFQFGSLFIFVGQKLTKMTKADIVKQLAQETGVEAVTVLAVVEGFMEEVRAFRGTGLKNCNDSIYRVVTTFI